MKKYFLVSIICFVLVILSCKNDPKLEKQQVQEEVVDSIAIVNEVIEEVKKPIIKKKKKVAVKVQKPKKEQDISVPPGAPVFTTLEARKYVRDYEAYVANYKKAVEAHADMDSFLKLSEASSNLSAQYRRLMSTLTGEEIEKMSKYMNEKSKQIDELSKKL